MTWLETITDGRMFEQERDAPRFRAAFRALAADCTHWPAPRDFLERLPRITANATTEHRIVDEAARERSRKAATEAIGKISEMLRLHEPAPYPAPPTLAPVEDFPRCCEKGTREKPLCDECREWARQTHGEPRAFQTPEEEADDFLG